MTGDVRGPDVSRLAPGDAIAALRSFPRRFRAVLAIADDEDDGVLHRPGPDGRSAVEHVDHAARTLATLADAVRRALEEERPVLHRGVVDEDARQPAYGLDADVQASLDLLVLEAEGLADRVEHVPADDWARAAAVAGGDDVTALDLLREAVRAVAIHLSGAERARA